MYYLGTFAGLAGLWLKDFCLDNRANWQVQMQKMESSQTTLVSRSLGVCVCFMSVWDTELTFLWCKEYKNIQISACVSVLRTERARRWRNTAHMFWITLGTNKGALWYRLRETLSGK